MTSSSVQSAGTRRRYGSVVDFRVTTDLYARDLRGPEDFIVCAAPEKNLDNHTADVDTDDDDGRDRRRTDATAFRRLNDSLWIDPARVLSKPGRSGASPSAVYDDRPSTGNAFASSKRFEIEAGNDVDERDATPEDWDAPLSGGDEDNEGGGSAYLFAHPLSEGMSDRLDIVGLSRTNRDWRTTTAVRPRDQTEERLIDRLVHMARLQVQTVDLELGRKGRWYYQPPPTPPSRSGATRASSRSAASGGSGGLGGATRGIGVDKRYLPMFFQPVCVGDCPSTKTTTDKDVVCPMCLERHAVASCVENVYVARSRTTTANVDFAGINNNTNNNISNNDDVSNNNRKMAASAGGGGGGGGGDCGVRKIWNNRPTIVIENCSSTTAALSGKEGHGDLTRPSTQQGQGRARSTAVYVTNGGGSGGGGSGGRTYARTNSTSARLDMFNNFRILGIRLSLPVSSPGGPSNSDASRSPSTSPLPPPPPALYRPGGGRASIVAPGKSYSSQRKASLTDRVTSTKLNGHCRTKSAAKQPTNRKKAEKKRPYTAFS